MQRESISSAAPFTIVTLSAKVMEEYFSSLEKGTLSIISGTVMPFSAFGGKNSLIARSVELPPTIPPSVLSVSVLYSLDRYIFLTPLWLITGIIPH